MFCNALKALLCGRWGNDVLLSHWRKEQMFPKRNSISPKPEKLLCGFHWFLPLWRHSHPHSDVFSSCLNRMDFTTQVLSTCLLWSLSALWRHAFKICISHCLCSIRPQLFSRNYSEKLVDQDSITLKTNIKKHRISILGV